MRLSFAIAALLLLAAAGCQRSTAAPSDDSDTSDTSDTGDAACPYDCIYPSACMAVNGEAHSEFSCELGKICCDLSSADTATESETESETETDTGSETDTDTDSGSDTGSDSETEDTDSDTDIDSESDTDLPDCPFECVTLVLCDLLDGELHAEFECPGDSICCETPPDTDKGAP